MAQEISQVAEAAFCHTGAAGGTAGTNAGLSLAELVLPKKRFAKDDEMPMVSRTPQQLAASPEMGLATSAWSHDFGNQSLDLANDQKKPV